MPNFYYTDANGQRGLITPQQLKALAVQGVITPDTELETETGQKGKAGQIKGLFATVPPPTSNPGVVNTVVKDKHNYRAIALAHRSFHASLWLLFLAFVLMNIANGVLHITRSETFPLIPLMFPYVLGVAGFHVVCVIRWAKSLHIDTLLIVLLTICLLIPLLNLLAWLLVHFTTVWMLKQAGYNIRFLGTADLQQFDDDALSSDGGKILPYWIALAGVVIMAISIIVGMLGSGRQVDTTGSPERAETDFVRDTEVTVSLQTHRDNEHGFSFRYPGDWQKVVRPMDIPNSPVIVAGQTDGDMPPLVVIIAIPETDVSNEILLGIPQTAFQSLLEQSGNNNVAVKEFGSKEIGGKTWLFCHYQATMDDSNLPIEEYRLSFIHNGKEFMIRARDSQANFGKNRSTFDSIINSFQFD